MVPDNTAYIGHGGADGTRTHDPLLAKQVLSPTELQPLVPDGRVQRTAVIGLDGPSAQLERLP